MDRWTWTGYGSTAHSRHIEYDDEDANEYVTPKDREKDKDHDKEKDIEMDIDGNYGFSRGFSLTFCNKLISVYNQQGHLVMSISCGCSADRMESLSAECMIILKWILTFFSFCLPSVLFISYLSMILK